MITLITPTHARPKAFTLLEGYIARQTYKGPLQWLVVCDAGIDTYRFTMGQEVIARDTSADSPDVHSICYNYLAALPYIKGAAVLCIEDDDWYRPDYLEVMSSALDQASLVGFAPAYYFHVTARRWRNLHNVGHCSLAATGFTTSVLPCFEQCCKVGNPYIDMILWVHWRGQGAWQILTNDFVKPIHVGIKGLPYGISGIGQGHDGTQGTRDIAQLRRWIGEDYWLYYDVQRRALK